MLEEVRGQDAARAVAGITGLEITVPRGRHVVPLPEGDRYLGFLVRPGGDTPEQVEAASASAGSTPRSTSELVLVELLAAAEPGGDVDDA